MLGNKTIKWAELQCCAIPDCKSGYTYVCKSTVCQAALGAHITACLSSGGANTDIRADAVLTSPIYGVQEPQPMEPPPHIGNIDPPPSGQVHANVKPSHKKRKHTDDENRKKGRPKKLRANK